MAETMTEEQWQAQLVNLYIEDWEREELTWEEMVELAMDRDDEAAEQLKLDFLEDVDA